MAGQTVHIWWNREFCSFTQKTANFCAKSVAGRDRSGLMTLEPAHRRPEADDGRNILSPRSHLALLGAAHNQGLNLDATTNDERARTLWAINLVRGNRDQVGS